MNHWLSPEDIYIVTPKSADEVEALRDDIELLMSYYPLVEDDIIDFIKQHPRSITVIYVNDQPAALMHFYGKEDADFIGKYAVEMHGMVKPEYEHLGIVQQVCPAVIQNLFETTDKKKILARIPLDHKAAQRCVAELGFERIEGAEEEKAGWLLYRLMKRDFLK